MVMVMVVVASGRIGMKTERIFEGGAESVFDGLLRVVASMDCSGRDKSQVGPNLSNQYMYSIHVYNTVYQRAALK